MRRLSSFFVLAAVTAAGCGSDETNTPGEGPGTDPPAETQAASIFVVPTTLDELSGLAFFDHPWPSDVRRDPDGTAHWNGWPNPRNSPLIKQYVADTAGLFQGFSPATAAYLRFSGALDPATLPADPPASLDPGAAVQIIDVDPASPERGTRHLASVYFHDAEGVYWPAHTLAVMPMLGTPLRPSTRYAVVVTSKVKTTSGNAVTRSPEFEEVLGLRAASAKTTSAHDTFASAVAEVNAAGVASTDIVHFTTFTTNDPTAEAFAVMDDVPVNVPAPKVLTIAKDPNATAYQLYTGTYGPSPNYQAGIIPFTRHDDGGSFSFENGKPKLVDTFDPRFALVVPNQDACPMPASGYPVALYAHGTGGSYRSFIDDGTASALVGQCVASMGIDQIFHGTRPGAPAENDPQRDTIINLLFFNLDNPLAARTSNRQAAVDVVQQARLFTETKTTIPVEVSGTAAPIGFDPGNVTFFGHSQGGLNGPIFLAGSGLARGGVLSGAGSFIGVAFLEKTRPVDVTAVFRLLVGLTDDSASELNLFHPAITLTQSLVDAADPLHYGAAITRRPRPGFAPKSIYQTEGIKADGTGDSYAPPHGIEALSIAIGLPRQAPGVRTVQEAVWAGLADVTVPSGGLQGNLAGGQASGVLAQFEPPGKTDGHFVVFNVREARAQAARFIKNLAEDPKGRVPAL